MFFLSADCDLIFASNFALMYFERTVATFGLQSIARFEHQHQRALLQHT